MLFYTIILCYIGVYADEMVVVGYGACRAPDAYKITGEYECLGGNEGCTTGDPLTQDDGIIVCPGVDDTLGTSDDGYLLCTETGISYANCSEACLEMDTCVGMEVTTNSNTGDGKCELHTVALEYASEQVCATYNGSGFTFLGYGACRTLEVNSAGNLYGTYNTTTTYNETDCKDTCAAAAWCVGIEYTIPLSGSTGKCELHKTALNYSDPTTCYRKVVSGGSNQVIYIIIAIVGAVVVLICVGALVYHRRSKKLSKVKEIVNIQG